MIEENNLEEQLKLLSEEQIQQALNLLQKKSIVFPELKGDGRPKNTIENFKVLLNHYDITIRYNEMSKEYEIDIPNFKYHTDLKANSTIAQIRSWAHSQGFPVTEIDNYILKVGSENSFHPVKDWLENGIEWDGVDRLPLYYNSIILDKDNPMKNEMMRKWALSLIGALYHNGFSCEGVLTMSGKQGKGKTIWINNLIPKDYQNIWNKGGVVIDMRNKDTIIKALKYWVCELGEVDATFKRSEIEALKGFITENKDVLRLPYEKKPNEYDRRTVFYATVNEEEFLQDSENRRFWVLSISGFNHGTFDPYQFWKQIKVMYDNIKDKIKSASDRELNNEYGWFMSPEQRIEMAPLQESYKTIEPVEQVLEDNLLPFDASKGDWRNVTSILKACSWGTPNKRDGNIASKWLRKHGYTENSRKQFLVELVMTEAKTDDDYKKSIPFKKWIK
jgi:putative DNA primase/helicase